MKILYFMMFAQWGNYLTHFSEHVPVKQHTTVFDTQKGWQTPLAMQAQGTNILKLLHKVLIIWIHDTHQTKKSKQTWIARATSPVTEPSILKHRQIIRSPVLATARVYPFRSTPSLPPRTTSTSPSFVSTAVLLFFLNTVFQMFISPQQHTTFFHRILSFTEMQQFAVF